MRKNAHSRVNMRSSAASKYGVQAKYAFSKGEKVLLDGQVGTVTRAYKDYARVMWADGNESNHYNEWLTSAEDIENE